MILKILITLSLHAQINPSVIIGNEINWKPAKDLPPESREFALSRLVGKLTRDGFRCSAFVHPQTGEVFTARHCLGGKIKYAKFHWHDETYDLNTWVCREDADICHTLDFEPIETIRIPIIDKFVPRSYLLHWQENQVMISYSEKDHESSWIPWQIKHWADSRGGSSGGLFVVVNSDGEHIAYALHTGGDPDKKFNVATKISALP